MTTLTAQMLIGHGHQGHGGFEPTHYAFFSENDRQAWILTPQNLAGPSEAPGPSKIIWLPTQENPLEDGLLMLAVHVLKDPDVVEAVSGVFRNPDLAGLQIMKGVPPSMREALYNLCRGLDYRYRVVLTVMNGSSLIEHLGRLEDYQIDFEVCVSKYSRYYSHAAGEYISRGSLNNA